MGTLSISAAMWRAVRELCPLMSTSLLACSRKIWNIKQYYNSGSGRILERENNLYFHQFLSHRTKLPYNDYDSQGTQRVSSLSGLIYWRENEWFGKPLPGPKEWVYAAKWASPRTMCRLENYLYPSIRLRIKCFTMLFWLCFSPPAVS